MLAAIHVAASGLQVNDAPVSRRSAVRSALSALVVAPVAAVAAGNDFYADQSFTYAPPPGVPGFQYSAANKQKDGTAAIAGSTGIGPEFAKLIASSKASYEANSGITMTPEDEKKMIEKLRVRYPGVANK